MQPEPALVLVDTHQVADVDVFVHALHVGEAVVDHAVLHLPDVGAAAQALQRTAGQRVNPGARAETAVAAVVHHVEARAGDEQAQQHALGQRKVPRRSKEDQMDVEADHAAHNDCGLGVELAVSLARNRCAFEVLSDPDLQGCVQGWCGRRELRGHWLACATC